MIRIYTFTYAGDAQEAVACVRCARTALPEAVVTVVDDSAAPVPPEARRALVAYGARYRRSSFPRCGNLRGPECVRGIIATLAKGAADGDTVVKIDSDTALLSGGWVREMKHNGLALHAAGYRVPRNPSERSAYGNCYALSGRAARMAAEALECAALHALLDPERNPAQDKTVAEFLGVSRAAVSQRRKTWQQKLAQMKTEQEDG